MKRSHLLCLFLVICMLFTACSVSQNQGEDREESTEETIDNSSWTESSLKQDEENSRPVSTPQKMVEVYYMNMLGQTAIDDMLLWYQKTYPEGPQINITVVQSIDQFNQSVEKNGLPDLLLIDKQHMDLMANPYQWIEKGAAEDLSNWLALDQSFDETQYLGGVLKAGNFSECQYMIPLSVRCSYMIMPENQAALFSETASSKDLLGALLTSYEENEETSESYTELRQFYSMSAGPVMALYEFMEQIGAIQVDREQKTVKVDEVLFEQAIRYMRYQQNAMNHAMEQGILQQSFDLLTNVCTTFTSNANPAFTLHYMDNASQMAEKEAMQIVPFPCEEMGKSYAACVTTVGMIGAQSKNKEEAYQVLRSLMDIPADDWQLIYGSENLKETPVNLKSAKDLVKLLEEEDKEELTLFLDQIQKGYVTDYEIYMILEKDLGIVFRDETVDIQPFAQLVKSDIEAYLAGKYS